MYLLHFNIYCSNIVTMNSFWPHYHVIDVMTALLGTNVLFIILISLYNVSHYSLLRLLYCVMMMNCFCLQCIGADGTLLHRWSLESAEGKTSLSSSMQSRWLGSQSEWGIRTTGVVVWLEKQQHDRFMAPSIRESPRVIPHRSNPCVFNVHCLKRA